FLAVAQAQREARSLEEGVAIGVSLPPVDPAQQRMCASLWLDLFASAVGRLPLPTVSFRGETGPWEQLCVFYRPADGSDLAAMLVDLDAAPIDNLNDVWQQQPVGGKTNSVDKLVAREPATLSALRSAVLATS